MSVYRCSCCEQYRDADEHECHENPLDERECVCLDCLVNSFSEENKLINRVI